MPSVAISSLPWLAVICPFPVAYFDFLVDAIDQHSESGSHKHTKDE